MARSGGAVALPLMRLLIAAPGPVTMGRNGPQWNGAGKCAGLPSVREDRE